MAERGGFEPPVGFKPTHAFQACALNHSAISPANANSVVDSIVLVNRSDPLWIAPGIIYPVIKYTILVISQYRESLLIESRSLPLKGRTMVPLYPVLRT